MLEMTLNRKYSLDIILKSLQISSYRLVYFVRKQLADPTQPLGRLSRQEQTTIEYHVDKQIQWLDTYTDATLEEIIKHKTTFEQVIREIVHEIRRPTSRNSSDEL